jgi:anti-anti-sigma regulatory factor
MGDAVVQTRWLTDDQVQIELSGAIEGDLLDTLREALVTALVRHRPARVLVDLRATTRLDPIAVGTLLAASDTAQDLGITLTIHEPHDATMLNPAA